MLEAANVVAYARSGTHVVPVCRCEECDALFTPKERRFSRFCSRSCWFAQAARDKAARDALKALDRIARKAARPAPMTREQRAAQSREAYRAKVRARRSGLTCKCCGATFDAQPGRKHRAFCSDRCRKRWHTRWYGTGSHRVRARRAGVEYQPINRVKVFERDGWTCRHCGIPTPREAMGTVLDHAPELDHVIPISKGGPHLYGNVQCLCRRCNAIKGDRLE